MVAQECGLRVLPKEPRVSSSCCRLECWTTRANLGPDISNSTPCLQNPCTPSQSTEKASERSRSATNNILRKHEDMLCWQRASEFHRGGRQRPASQTHTAPGLTSPPSPINKRLPLCPKSSYQCNLAGTSRLHQTKMRRPGKTKTLPNCFT